MTMTEPSLELAVRAQPLLPMRPEDARQVMQAYQDMCKSVLGPDDVQRVGDRQFTKRSGFQKLGAAYGVSTEIVSQTVTEETRSEGDKDHIAVVLVARVVARAIHPSGRHADGDGACASNEKRFRKGDEKMEHSLMATATTRAVNRAISNLIAFGSVSAEEVLEEGGHAPAGVPQWAEGMNDTASIAHNMMGILRNAGVSEEDAAQKVSEIGREIMQRADNSFPWIAAHVVWRLRNAIEEQETVEPEGDLTRDATIAEADEAAADNDNDDNEEK